MSGYIQAMKAAGAEVLRYQYFGSYQGEWWAEVTYKGETGWVHSWFGSCSVCDAYEYTFDWDAEQDPNYQQKLAEFGQSYLDDIMSESEAIEQASRDLEWDHEAAAMVKYIKRE